MTGDDPGVALARFGEVAGREVIDTPVAGEQVGEHVVVVAGEVAVVIIDVVALEESVGHGCVTR